LLRTTDNPGGGDGDTCKQKVHALLPMLPVPPTTVVMASANGMFVLRYY